MWAMKKAQTEDLTRQFLSVKGIKTAIYSIGDVDKPLILLVHGFGGDYFGLSFLAQELVADWRVVLVELPSHGASDLAQIKQKSELQTWYRELIESLEAKFGKISVIFGHSFGCYAVADTEIIRKIPTILANPVFKPTKFYLLMSKMSLKSKIVGVMQNLPPMTLIKALFLWKSRARGAWRNIRRNAVHTKFNYRQTLAQSQMLGIVFEKEIFRQSRGCYKLVIFGEFDDFNQETAAAELEDLFGKTQTVTLPGGHLVPIELPKQVAQAITREMLGQEAGA